MVIQLTRYDNQGKKSCWTHPATANQSLSILVHWVVAKNSKTMYTEGRGGDLCHCRVHAMRTGKWRMTLWGEGLNFLSQWHYLSNSRFNSSTVVRNVYNIDIDNVHVARSHTLMYKRSYTSHIYKLHKKKCHNPSWTVVPRKDVIHKLVSLLKAGLGWAASLATFDTKSPMATLHVALIYVTKISTRFHKICSWCGGIRGWRGCLSTWLLTSHRGLQTLCCLAVGWAPHDGVVRAMVKSNIAGFIHAPIMTRQWVIQTAILVSRTSVVHIFDTGDCTKSNLWYWGLY